MEIQPPGKRCAAAASAPHATSTRHPVGLPTHPRNPRNPWSGVQWRTFADFASWRFDGGGPQTTQTDAELGGPGLRLGAHRLRSPEGGSLDELSFDAVVSRSIGTDGLRSLGDAATPNPLRKRRGLDVLGTGDRGWRPDGLTPGYCLKPFQGFEDGLGKGRESAELMTGVASTWEVWRRDVSSPEVIEDLDGGWDVSSQGVLVSKTWECGDETSPPPKSVRVWMGAGTSRPRGCWFRRRGSVETRRLHPRNN